MKTWAHSRLARHGLFWGAGLGINFLMQLPAYYMGEGQLYVWGLFFNQLPAAVLATYSLLYWLLPRLLRRQVLQFAGLVVVWALATWVLTELTRNFYDFVVGPRLFGEVRYPEFDWRPYREFDWRACRLSFTWFAVVATAGTACAIKVANGWYEQRRLSELLLQRRLRTELELLKTQLQPAFLFDTLRTLQRLTRQKSPDSPAAVLHLAAVLRHMLYQAPRETVLLADEVELLQHYVALEQLRLGARVEVSLSFSGAFSGHTVAPLLLLPLVQNAFRHGTSSELECPWVSIDLVTRRDTLILKILNSQAPAGPALRESHGLHCLRQRLAHLYPARHELKILTEPDTFFVVLQLELAPLPAATPGLAPAAARPLAEPLPA